MAVSAPASGGGKKAPEIVQDWIRLAEQELTDLPPADRRARAERIVWAIVDEYGGQQYYLPANFHRRAELARQVYQEFDGNNMSELVRRHKRSVSAIYRLISLGRQLELQDRQGDLFGAAQ